MLALVEICNNKEVIARLRPLKRPEPISDTGYITVPVVNDQE